MASLILGIALCAAFAASAHAACPTPSGAGYSCQDSSVSGGVPYAFEDISSTGAALGIPDDRSAIIPIGFDFNYFLSSYTHLSVTDNGHLDFAYGWGNESANDAGYGIPTASNLDPFSSNYWGVNPLIAVWFDDLDPFTEGEIFHEVRGAAPERRLIIQWDRMKHYSCSSADTLTFQAVLFESTGSILMQYADATTSGCSPAASQGASATVGLDLDSTTGLEYSANSALLTDGLAVLFEPGAAPVISASAALIDFGLTNTGGRDSRAIMLQNAGGSLLFFGSIGGLSAEFTLDADTCSGAYLQPGQSCGLGVSFSPTVDGALSNTLTITSNATMSPLDIALSGNAQAIATQDIAVLNPASLVYDFGSVNVGSSSTISVIVGNDGVTNSLVFNGNGMGVSNTPTGAFSFTSNSCGGASLAPGNTCFRNLRFAPTEGGVQTSFFDIASDDPDEGSLIVFVRGTGVVQSIPDMAVTESTQPTNDLILAFGTMGIGTEATETVRIANEGTGPLTISSTVVSNAIFVVTQNGCGAGTQLPAGASCSMSISFSPTTALTYTGTLTINSNDPDDASLVISLSGTGTSTPTPQISLVDPIAPTYDLSVPFGQTTTGSSYNAVLTIKNNGNAALVLYGISSPGGPFSVASGSCASATLAQGESCGFTVYFKPTLDAAYTGSLDIQSNDPDSSPLTVSLSGEASSPTVPDIDASDPVPPTNDLSIDMGSALAGLKIAKGVILRNLGTKSLQLGIIYATGANFDLERDLCSTAVLAPGAACSFDAMYLPSAIATDTGSITIPSDDPDENPLVIALRGSGSATQYPDVYVADPSAPSNDLALDFGQTQSGESMELTIYVGNSGHSALVVNAVSTTNVLAAPFSISADGCTGATVPAGGACPINIAFSPTTLASSSDAFNITTNDPDMQTIAFQVRGQGVYGPVPAITLSESSAPSADMVMDFGAATVGEPTHATHTLTVGNLGSTILTIGTITKSGSAFNIKSGTCIATPLVPIGSACDVVVEFIPTLSGPQSGSLSVPSNDPDMPTATITLVGRGVTSAVPDISVTSPSSLAYAFGRLASASLPAAGTINVSNAGWAQLDVSTVSAPLAPFAITSDTCGSTGMAPSGSCSIGISFDPASLGSYSGAIKISSNDPDEPDVTISLSGSYVPAAPVGSPPTAPVLLSPENGAVDVSVPVTFKWQASTDPDGDALTYELAYATDPTMAGATVITVASTASSLDARYASAEAGGAGVVLLAGALWLGSAPGRRRIMLALAAMALLLMVAACGSGVSATDSGAPETPADEITYTASDLIAGATYYWSVTAVDSAGNRTGSGSWSFNTAN